VSNVSSSTIQSHSNNTVYPPHASATSQMTANQSNYVTSNSSSFVTGSIQNLSSASGSTPTLSGASDHDGVPIGGNGGGMNVPIGNARMLPPGSRPPGLAPPHILDHNYMSQVCYNYQNKCMVQYHSYLVSFMQCILLQ